METAAAYRRAMHSGGVLLAGVTALAFALALPCAARDLSLAEAEQLMLTNNRELQAARRAIESAEAQGLIAGARPNATFSFNSSSINSNPGIGPGPLYDKRVDTVLRIDQPFERVQASEQVVILAIAA